MVKRRTVSNIVSLCGFTIRHGALWYLRDHYGDYQEKNASKCPIGVLTFMLLCIPVGMVYDSPERLIIGYL